MTTTIWLVRHGQTDWNAQARFMGQTDIPLNQTGFRQAECAARRLAAALNPSPSPQPGGNPIARATPLAIYASDLTRAWQTADVIYHGLTDHFSAPLVREPQLREMSFGKWEGLTHMQIEEQYPELFSAWLADRESYSPPDGENFRDFARRVGDFYTKLVSVHAGQSVLLVSHGGVLQVMIALALGLPATRFWQYRLSNASLSELRIYPHGTVLYRLNSCDHLEEAVWGG